MNPTSSPDSTSDVPLPPRSPLLMNRDDTALVVIDIQEKLLPLIDQHETILGNVRKLLAAAELLNVAVGCTEQYPKGLGPTVSPIADAIKQLDDSQIAEKIMFSCRECESLFQSLSNRGIHKLLLCGIESHVCVAQTALDMLASGFDVFLCVDAIGARNSVDHRIAIRRLESAGCTLTTTEAAMFEWCVKAGSDSFKAISKLVVQGVD